jgi:hypothetical protein
MTKSVLEEILESGDPPSEDQLRGVIAAFARASARTELASLDFKIGFDASSNKDWLELLKDIVAMANAGGGLLVFGIDRDGNALGCSPDLVRDLDPAAIVDKLRKYAPQVHIQVNPYGLVYQGDQLASLVIQRGTRIIVFERDGQYEDPTTRRSKTVFYAGIVYTRTAGGNAPARQLDLDQMVSYFAEQQIRRMVARIGQVATLPPGTDLIASDPSNPSLGYRLLDHGLGMPVRLVAQDDDEWGIRLTEVHAPHVPFSDVDAEIAGQVRHWRHVSDAHRVDRHTLARWYLDREHITLNETGLVFCVLSACHMYGFPMYWASLLPHDRLRQIVEDLIRQNDHPDRNAIPYLVGAFFWSDRSSVLAPLTKHANVTVRSAACRLIAMSEFSDFARTGRYRAETCKIGGIQFRMADIVTGRQFAEATFDDLVRRDIQDDLSTEKQVAYQLDILLHARERE